MLCIHYIIQMHLICHIIKEIYNHTICNILFLINAKKNKIKKIMYFTQYLLRIMIMIKIVI